MRTTILTVLVLAAAVAGAGAGAAYAPPTYEEFRRTAAFPFIAGKDRVAKIRAGFPQLRRCMSTDEVRRLMGEPDHGDIAYRGSSKVPEVITWKYVLEMRAAEDFKTSSVAAVWLHLDGRVRAASVHGIPGLVGLDGMANEKCSSR